MGLVSSLVAASLLSFAPSGTGLKVGEFANAFEPKHVSGPDANTETCPVCKYGLIPGVLVWVNGMEADTVLPIADFLEKKLATKGMNRFRAFFVFYNPEGAPQAEYEAKVKALSQQAKSKNVAFTTLPAGHHSIEDYKFGASSEKVTVLVYRKVRVNHRFSNPTPSKAMLADLSKAIDTELIAHAKPK